jgi:hypothetical protein
MREPLFDPAPVVAARVTRPLDAAAVGVAASNAIGDATNKGAALWFGGTIGRRVVFPEPIEKANIVGVGAENPIELSPGKTQEIEVLRS